jgi:hypothetical protein
VSDLPCDEYPGGDTVCSGEARSFDGSPLDVDVTLPRTGGTRHPLMVMFHGFGNNKHEWESTTDEGDSADKYHWNSHWFAKHGYYVLTYTARGFTDQGPDRPDQPETPAGTDPNCPRGGSDCTPSGTIRVKNKDVEIRDSQYLAALTAKAFPGIDPQQVAVSGGSYGGGESWLQAADPQWTFPHSQDSDLPVLQLQVAVPKYGWTDLAYSLVPNGHPGFLPGDPDYSSSQGAPDTPGVGNPIGASKQSYIAGLYALGQTTGTFEDGEAPSPTGLPCNQREPFNAWLTRVNAGEPYSTGRVDDPVVADIRQDFSKCHSAYYQPGWKAQRDAGHETAVFAIQGWTDDLFEAVESFRMFKYLKGLDPLWPVAVGVGDVGHARAQNKPSTWRSLNNQANQFLQAQISGSHHQQTTVFSEPTLCPNNPNPGPETAAQQLTARTPEGLSDGKLTIVGPAGQTTNPLAATDPDGPATDAVIPSRLPAEVLPTPDCRESVTPTAPPGRYTAVSAPLPQDTTYVGLGSVEVPYELTGGLGATLNSRVWVLPDAGGPALLVTRGTYRIDTSGYDPAAGTLRLPLYGNHWPLRRGDRIRLDLTQVDSPTYRPDNRPSTIEFTKATLTLPTRSARDITLPAVSPG